ncbi:MAG: hypothetical protein U9P49_09015 [Thermodesulfobacteriota bacterium]|nr:hypothetical protein [Thermodesulfobacteriota bacterium]
MSTIFNAVSLFTGIRGVTAQVIGLKDIRLKDTDIPWAAKAVFGEYYT